MLKRLVVALGLASLAWAQPPGYVALGDSLGEGVQSADASYRSQPYSYVNHIATQLGVTFPLPLIQDGPFTTVESVSGRTRIDPSVETFDLAVSGADTTSILTQAAGTPITDETDLVLSPRTGTQVQIAQSLQAPFMTCWIGSNDALGTILAFDQLDASQLTPVPTFAATGSYTSAVAMLLLKLGLADSTLLQNPSWVLDASEVQTIESTIQQYNQIIAQDAAAVHMPVVNINSLLEYVHANGIPLGTITLSTRYLGGMFSLDGVHPSNIGHAIVANAFLKTANSAFNLNAPLLTSQQLLTILVQDPFVDFNGNLKVRGRPYAGLLETLGPYLGISGDTADGLMRPGIDAALGRRFMRAYFTATGRDANTAWTQSDAVEAMRRIFGVQKLGVQKRAGN